MYYRVLKSFRLFFKKQKKEIMHFAKPTGIVVHSILVGHLMYSVKLC